MCQATAGWGFPPCVCLRVHQSRLFSLPRKINVWGAGILGAALLYYKLRFLSNHHARCSYLSITERWAFSSSSSTPALLHQEECSASGRQPLPRSKARTSQPRAWRWLVGTGKLPGHREVGRRGGTRRLGGWGEDRWSWFLWSGLSLLNRPSPVGLNNLVNLIHQPNRLLERHDDALVVGNVVFGGEVRRGRAALAVTS